MKKFLKNRTAIGIMCIFLAFILTMAIAPLLNKSKNKKIEVITINKNIERGEAIRTEDISIIKVFAQNIPKEILKKDEEQKVINKYAKIDLFKNQFIVEKSLSNEKLSDSAYLEDELSDKNKLAVSVTIKTLASGLSSKLESGDIVSIFVSDKEKKEDKNPDDKGFLVEKAKDNVKEECEAEIDPYLKFVKVITTSNPDGEDKNYENEENEEKKLIATATLLVSEAQAKRLVYYEQNKNIHLALLYRGDKKEADKLLKTQEIFVENEKKIREEIKKIEIQKSVQELLEKEKEEMLKQEMLETLDTGEGENNEKE